MPPKIKRLSIIPLLKEIKDCTKLARDVLKLYGLPIEYKDYTHQSLLEAAISTNNVEVVKLLINKGCSVTVKSLLQAIDIRDIRIVKIILETDKDLILLKGNKIDGLPLHYAAKKKAKNIVELFLSKGANYNDTDNMGNTVLHAAVEDIDDNKIYDKSMTVISLIKMFLDLNLPVDIQNRFGETPLHVAAKSKDKEVVEFLLSQNANFTACDKKGNSMLHMTIKHNNIERYARDGYNHDYENDITVQQEDKITAEFVQWLISIGADANHHNHANESPLFLSVINHRKEVTKVLLYHVTRITDCDNNHSIFNIFLSAYLKVGKAANDEIITMIIQFLEKGAAINDINPIVIAIKCEQMVVKDILVEYYNKRNLSI